MDLIVDACAIALVINWVIALLLWQLRFGSYQSAPGPIFTGWPFCYASSVGRLIPGETLGPAEVPGLGHGTFGNKPPVRDLHRSWEPLVLAVAPYLGGVYFQPVRYLLRSLVVLESMLGHTTIIHASVSQAKP